MILFLNRLANKSQVIFASPLQSVECEAQPAKPNAIMEDLLTVLNT